MVFIIIGWQEARPSCDSKEQELPSFNITPSRMLLKLFCILPSLFSLMTEGCTLPSVLSDEVVMFQIRKQVVFLEPLSAGDQDKIPVSKLLFSFRWLGMSDRKKFLN